VKRVTRSLITAGVVVVLGGGVGYYAWSEGYLASQKQALQAREDKRLFHFGTDDVVSGKLVAGKITIDFRRDEAAGWMLDAPVTGPADHEAINALLTRMAAIKNDAVAIEAPSDAQLTEYGFDDPTAQLQVELRDGTKQVLLIGGENKVKKAYYITDAAKETIGLAADSSFWVFDRELFAYRAKEIFRTEVNGIASVQVSKGGESQYGLRKVDGKWMVDMPDGSSHGADPSIVGRFLLVLSRDLKAESFPTDTLSADDPVELKRYGLDAPAFELAVTTEAGLMMRSLVSRQGDDVSAGGPFLQMLDTTTVIGIYEAFVGDLDKTADYFRDRTVASFDADTVHKVTFSFVGGGRAVVEARDDGKWRMTEPEDKPAKAWAVIGIIAKLSKFRSTRVFAESAVDVERQEWQLDPPRSRVVLESASGDVVADIRIGKRLDEDHYFVTEADLGRVDVIEAGGLAFLPGGVQALVDVERK